MTERDKQTAFLKKMLLHEQSRLRADMEERLACTQRDEKCILRAVRLVVLLAILSLSGLCYEAVFVSDFFSNPSYWLTRLFGYLFAASGLCLLGFGGFWLWYRALTNRTCEECRRLLADGQHHAPLGEEKTAEDAPACKLDTPPQSAVTLPKAA